MCVLIGFGGLSGCNSVPLLAPSGAVLNLFANAAAVPLNGTTTLVATVVNNGSTSTGTTTTTATGAGTPVEDGTVISFTTTVGTIQPATATTVGGQATVTFNAGTQSGSAQIFAYSGGAKNATAVAILVGGAAVAKITLQAAPETLPSTGGTTTVTALVLDTNGNTLPGTTVTFATSVGTLSATTATTNSAGVATVTLTTTRIANVTATVNGASAIATTPNPLVINVNPLTTLAFTLPAAVVASVPASISVTPGSAGGASGSVTTISSLVLDFGDGSTKASLGAVSQVTAVQHIYSAAGSYPVVATATNTDGSVTTISTTIIVTPLTLNVTASTTSATAGSAFTFTATPSTGASIDHYVWVFGDGSTTTTAGGSVSHIFVNSGQFTISVTAVPSVGVSVVASTTITVTPISLSNLTASPASAPHGTSIQFTVTASAGANFVNFDWNFGDGGTATTSTGGVNHVFATAGTFTVTVTGTNASGVQASATLVIIIT